MIADIGVFKGKDGTIDVQISLKRECTKNIYERNFTRQQLFDYIDSIWTDLGDKIDTLNIKVHWKE